jgi:hypothetical protein
MPGAVPPHQQFTVTQTCTETADGVTYHWSAGETVTVYASPPPSLQPAIEQAVHAGYAVAGQASTGHAIGGTNGLGGAGVTANPTQAAATYQSSTSKAVASPFVFFFTPFISTPVVTFGQQKTPTSYGLSPFSAILLVVGIILLARKHREIGAILLLVTAGWVFLNGDDAVLNALAKTGVTA